MPEHRHRGRVVGAALGAALAAGLVTGLTARLLMRVLSLLIGVESGEFSVAGTAMIVFVFTVLAVPAAATAVARPAIRRTGRWFTAVVTGWAAARTGLADAKALLLADDERLPLLAGVLVAFAALVAAHGWLAQRLTRRPTIGNGEPAGIGEPAGAQAAGP